MFTVREYLAAAVFFGLIAISVSLGGCAQNYASPQQAADSACSSFGPRAQSGMLIGAVAGAAGGAAIAAAATHGNGSAELIGAGAGLLGGLITGSAIGHHLDQGDCAAAQAALQQMSTQKTGVPIAWTNASTGSKGSYIPTGNAYDDPTGQVCRPFVANYALQGEQPVTGDTGITCRTADGDWVRQAPPAAPATSTPAPS